MKRSISIVLIIGILLMTITGCTSKETLSQGVTEEVVKVGNTAATSGAFAAVGVPFNAGIEAYFKMVNDAGGID